MLNEKELQAVKYYIGDVDTSKDSFWSEPKAYLVINSLLYPDTNTEKARASENKFLNPVIINDIERLTNLYQNLFSAFKKCTVEKDTTTFRVERFSDYIYTKNSSCTVSFTSTSTVGFLNAYRDRAGIALMQFNIKTGVPCIDMSKILESYGKPDEAEILLPPFLSLDITEIPVTKEQQRITDSENKPPFVSCKVETGNIIKPNISITDFPENCTDSIKRFYDCLNNKKTPSIEDENVYIQFKKALLSKISLFYVGD